MMKFLILNIPFQTFRSDISREQFLNIYFINNIGVNLRNSSFLTDRIVLPQRQGHFFTVHPTL